MQKHTKSAPTFFKNNRKSSPEEYDDNSEEYSDSSEECEYDFTPIKNDSSDESTQALFEQLEEGAKWDTDIYGTLKEGANLYAKKTTGIFEDCFPIHIAAYNVGFNTEAISKMLQIFNDPEKRKKYIYLKDGSDKHALEILLEVKDEMDQEYSLASIISILSYLTADEQRNIMSTLSQKAKKILDHDETPVSREEDIKSFAELNYFLKSGNTINMCTQRRKEESKVLANYDSDEESLGKLDSVYNKKFTARVSYKEIIKTNEVVESIPELILVPSDWRLETAIQGNNQGDHVIAYVLLLSSFSHCKGEKVKKLPELVFKLAADVLPDHINIFLEEKLKVDEALSNYRKVRVEAVSSLQAECDKDVGFINVVENNLKKAEIEVIARHIEDGIDQFIMFINKLQDESFSQERKASLTRNYILQQLILMIEKIAFLNEKKYASFKIILLNAIDNEAKKQAHQTNSGITEKTLKSIADTILKEDLSDVAIPKQLLSPSANLTQTTLLNFLKTHTPCKKYHEGHAINQIEIQILSLKKISNQTTRNKLLNRIGFLCFNLFDYPKVNDAKLNDEYVLYQAIPRHLIIINSAFSYLKDIAYNEKQIIYDAFLNNILRLQLWDGHQVLNNKQEIKPLNLDLLKERILEFANLDKDHNFSMKPKSLHPQHLRVSDIDDNAKPTKKSSLIH